MKNKFSKLIKISYLGLGIFILLFIFNIKIILAIETEDLFIAPSNPDPNNELTKYWFIYNLRKGECKNDSLDISNLSERIKYYKIYAVDGLTTNDGNFALRNESEPREDIGAWVQLSTSTLELPPKEIIKVPFVICIPPDAEPGDHIGGIVLEDKEVFKGQQINVVTRTGVRIYETVPGKIIKKLILKSFTKEWDEKLKSYIFKLNIYNTGNVRIQDIDGKFEIINSLNKTIIDDNFKINIIFPKKEITYPIKWEPSNSIFGNLLARVTLSYKGLKQPIIYEYNFIIIPWWVYASIGLLIIAILLITVKIAIRNKRKYQKKYFKSKPRFRFLGFVINPFYKKNNHKTFATNLLNNYQPNYQQTINHSNPINNNRNFNYRDYQNYQNSNHLTSSKVINVIDTSLTNQNQESNLIINEILISLNECFDLLTKIEIQKTKDLMLISSLKSKLEETNNKLINYLPQSQYFQKFKDQLLILISKLQYATQIIEIIENQNK